LAKLGYTVLRQKGSHARLVCSVRSPVTVPMHHEIDRGTLRSIIRTAEISVEEFNKLLG
jgi:predicted RNA binding protein YcfA (HicA-like mRNA interferase family)